MYSKMFPSMYQGSLATRGPWEAMVTFQQMLILADAAGNVDMTPEYIAKTSTIPLDIIQKGINALEEPDPESRTTDLEGRRIVRLSEKRSWGWLIVNYTTYHAIRNEEQRREYMKLYHREYRKKQKKIKELEKTQTQINPVNKNKPTHTHTHTHTQTQTQTQKDISLKKRKTKWPEGFSLSDYRRKKAERYWQKHQMMFDAKIIWDSFENYHLSHGSMFRDWEYAWVTWYGKKVEYQKSKTHTSHRCTRRHQKAGRLVQCENMVLTNKDPMTAICEACVKEAR